MGVSVLRWSMLRARLFGTGLFLMMSTFLIHMRSNSKAKWSPPSRGTCLDHIWLKFAAWQRDKVLRQGAYVWTTSGQSLQWDKVLWLGAHFGPHLVKVRSETKSSNEGHILDHIWSKSAAWQNPPMRGTIWAMFVQSPQWDKVLQWGASFSCHIWPMSTVWQVPPMTDDGHHFLATFGQSLLRDMSSNKCCKLPRYVPYKCTYVPYGGTLGKSDQGQTLDVWVWHPADVNAEVAVTPDVTTSSWKIPWTSQDISVGISANLLDHMGWIQGWIQFNWHPVH
jgi:hypothetical protein